MVWPISLRGTPSSGEYVRSADMVSQPKAGRVMSSCLCKYGEGAGFPFQVESLEDGIDDAVHALDIYEADHGPGATAHLHETALDHIGGAQLAPQVGSEGEERQQLRQVLRQAPYHVGVGLAPARLESTEGGFGPRPAFCQIDSLGRGLHLVVVALADFL